MKNLVLIGGGHSHAITLKQWGMNPLPNVQLTLITDVEQTPYSGMLPGYIAGYYTFDECHIDLRPLTEFAQGKFYLDKAIDLDLEKNLVFCANSPPIPFDILSIDIGSVPATLTIPGATEHTIPVKPISQFLHYWEQIIAQVKQNPEQKLSLGIVGGGAGGVELALNAQQYLKQLYLNHHQSADNLELHLIHRGERLLPERHPDVSKKVEKLLRNRGVNLHCGETVIAVKNQDINLDSQKIICCESGLRIKCDRIFWVTQASAASWLKTSGLATDERGFILVNDTLQSISHPHVFAAGDIATMVNHPRPKAGVFAVRQGKPLYYNLTQILQEKPLKPFIPQQEFLILIGTGDKKAIASRGFLNFGSYSFLWHWKDYIDRKFMEQLRIKKRSQESGVRRIKT